MQQRTLHIDATSRLTAGGAPVFFRYQPDPKKAPLIRGFFLSAIRQRREAIYG